MESVVSVLMKRDNISREEAESQVNNFKEVIDDMLEEGAYGEIEEEFQCAFGLEPDYLLEILPI